MAKPAQNRLWTPVSNAFEAYRRRLLVNPTGVYENIWRLIHIEEALVVTLGSVLATRLFACWKNQPDKRDRVNQLRKLVTGLSDDSEAQSQGEASEAACWQGSIGAWTDLLNHFGAKDTVAGCPFCESVTQYLQTELPNEPLAFIESWQRIGPVAETFKTTRSRIGRIKAINSLRNKLAHVPISERILRDLHAGIRKEVLALITPDESVLNSSADADPRTNQCHQTLLGRIGAGKAYVTGAEFGVPASFDDNGVWIEWAAGNAEPLHWSAAPFLQLDEELKVLLLFRLPGLEADLDENEQFLTGEYHRFAAEIEPVQELEVPVKTILPWIPTARSERIDAPNQESGIPITTITTTTSTSTTTTTTPPYTPVPAEEVEQKDFSQLPAIELRTKAETAYRNRNYPLATRFLDELASRDSNHLYNHVTKLRHGEVLWKSSERGDATDTERIEGIQRAIALLKEASDHRDVRYAARAKYQLSKAFWHLWRYTRDEQDLRKSISEAQEAANLVFESQYISWFERIRQEDSQGVVKELLEIAKSLRR